MSKKLKLPTSSNHIPAARDSATGTSTGITNVIWVEPDSASYRTRTAQTRTRWPTLAGSAPSAPTSPKGPRHDYLEPPRGRTAPLGGGRPTLSAGAPRSTWTSDANLPVLVQKPSRHPA